MANFLPEGHVIADIIWAYVLAWIGEKVFLRVGDSPKVPSGGSYWQAPK